MPMTLPHTSNMSYGITGPAPQCVQEQVIQLVAAHEWKMVKNIIQSPNFELAICTRPITVPTTLLHVACSIPTTPVDILSTLIHLYPQACKIQDEDGNLPIHFACTASIIRPNVIEILLSACPETSFIPSNSDGDLPLYFLIRRCLLNHGMDAALELISGLPQSLLFNDQTSVLHQVCNDLLPYEIICKIIDLHPAICRIHVNGNTLLHMTCSHEQSTTSTIRLIINHYPEACAMKDEYGNLPLHLVNSATDSVEVIRVLLNAYPKALLVKNNAAQIPLASPLIRCSSNRVKEILKYCQSLGPNFHSMLLQSRNHHGLTTAHDLFYSLQRRLTEFVTLNIISMNDISSFGRMEYTKLISNDLESLFYFMRFAIYNNVDYTVDTPHQDPFWTSFPLFTKILLNHSPELMCHKDNNGDLPLHVITRHTFHKLHTFHCVSCGSEISGPHIWHANNAQCSCSRCQINCYSSPHIEYEGHELIRDMVAMNPQHAEIPDCHENLPLYSSLKSGKTWSTGVRELIYAAPKTLDSKDKDTGMYPFMVAAATKEFDGSFSRGQKLTTIYELLRRNPSQLCSLSHYSN